MGAHRPNGVNPAERGWVGDQPQQRGWPGDLASGSSWLNGVNCCGWLSTQPRSGETGVN